MDVSATLPRRRQIRRLAATADEFVERLPAALVVGAIFVAASAMWGFYALQVTDWFVQTDELQVVRLALTISDELALAPAIRGVPVDANSQFYPLLLAPLYGALDTPAAFKAAHLLNALLMASTAVPAYLLARELLTSRLAGYLVAALSVLVPWMAFADMLRAEALAYPVFTWAVLAMQRAVVDPSALRDLLALVAIGAAFWVRTQFIGLALSFAAAVVAYTLLHPQLSGIHGDRLRPAWEALKRAARAHWLLIAAGALALAVAAVRGLRSLLGSYAGTAGEGDLLPPGLTTNIAKHVAIVALGVGVIPFALGFAWAIASVVRPATRQAHAFALLALFTAVMLCVQASSFVIRFAGPAAFDRYFFYLVPMALVAMVACIEEGRRRWWLVAATAPLFAWVVRFGVFVPFPGPYHASPASAFYAVIEFHGGRVGLTVLEAVRWVGFVATLAVALSLRLLPARVVLCAIGVVLVAFSLGQSRSVFRSMENDQVGSPYGHPDNPDWIDDLVPAGERVALMPGVVTVPPEEHPIDVFAGTRMWWDTEFWNKRVQDAYVLVSDPGADVAPFSKRFGEPDLETGRLKIKEFPPSEQVRYLVIDPRRADLRPTGRTLGSSPGDVLRLIRAEPPYRLDYAATGLIKGGWMTPGKPAFVYTWGREPRTVKLRLLAPPEILRPSPYEVRAEGRTYRGLIPSSGAGAAVVRVCVSGGRSRIGVRAPAKREVFGTGLVGVRIASIGVTSRPRGC